MKKQLTGNPPTKPSKPTPNRPRAMRLPLRSNRLQPILQQALVLAGCFGERLGGATGAGGRRREGVVEALVKSAESVGSQVGRAIIRGVRGSNLGGRR